MDNQSQCHQWCVNQRRLKQWGWVCAIGLLLFIVPACSATESTPEANSSPLSSPTEASTPFLPPSAAGALFDDDSLLYGAVETDETLLPDTTALATEAKISVALPTIDPLEIKGNITVGGSSTVYPLTRRLYRRFVREGYAGVMKIEQVGTTEGFRLLCSTGTADIVNAGRMVMEAEEALCTSLNRAPIPFAIGRAALVPFVNSANEGVTALTQSELQRLLTANSWSEVDPTWPNEPILLLLPRPETDEYAALVRLVLEGDAASLTDARNITFYDTTIEFQRTLAEEPYALGIANHLLLLQEMDPELRSVRLERLLPDAMTVRLELYPLVYPLYLYSDPGIVRNKPQVAAFLNFYLNHVNEEIRQVGYFTVDVIEMDAARARLISILND